MDTEKQRLHLTAFFGALILAALLAVFAFMRPLAGDCDPALDLTMPGGRTIMLNK